MTTVKWGVEERFAVRAELELIADRFVFGNVNLVISGETVGDNRLRTLLPTVANSFSGFLSNEGKRPGDQFAKELESGEILRQIWCGYYGGEDCAEESDFPTHQYFLCPGPGPTFDGTCIIVLEGESTDRLIWRPEGEVNVKAIEMSRDEYVNPLEGFIRWALDLVPRDDDLSERP